MKLARLAPLSAALLLAWGAPARAESLLELYEMAKAYDATWQGARAQYDANLARAEQAKAGLWPTAGLQASATRTRFENDNPPIERSYTTKSAALSASQPLYRPANVASAEQGDRQLRLAEYALTTASQDLIIRVSQAYFDVLAAQDTLTFVRAQKAANAEQLAAAKRNFEVGTSTITDTREAQARYDLVVAQEIAAENDLRVKKLALDNLVGKRDVQPNPLATPLNVQAPQPADAEAWVDKIRHAGAIFIGPYTSEALGDYCAGPNHVLPTMRSARFSSPLGVYDFQKRTSLIDVSEAGAQTLGRIASILAHGEGLQAHARSAEMRLKR